MAYEKLRSVYFDLSRAPGYGRLSGIDAAKVRVGASVDLSDYEKLNPRDFALLRRCRLSDLKRGAFVKSPWGNVRPAWHLQTAAAASAALGFGFDLYVGAQELLFPHHENENAIAEALTGAPLARTWIAVAPVTGEAPAVEELLAAGVSGRSLRGFLLSLHYRRPLAFSPEKLAATERALSRVDSCLSALQAVGAAGDPSPEADQLAFDLRQGVRTAIDSDLDLPAAFAAIFKAVRRVNALLSAGAPAGRGARRLLEAFRELQEVLHLFDFGASEALPAELQSLLERRARARAEGDFATADRLREEILRLGVRVQDGPLGKGGPPGGGGAP
ncbi:MAG: DALR domain-containing protein [Desulfobacterales bacterium]